MKADNVIPEEQTVAARGEVLEDLKSAVRRWAKQAAGPAKRVATAELEHEIAEMEKRWTERGLIPTAA